MKITTIVSVAVAVIASTISISAAVAAPAPDQIKVSYADLNLGSPQGRGALDRRIEAAAMKVCGVDPDERQIGIVQESARCYGSAVDQARVAIASNTQPVFASR